MKTLFATLSLLIAGGIATESVEAHDRTLHVAAAPVAEVAVWGNSRGHHGQSVAWTVGWSGALAVGSTPVYPASAYAVVPSPHVIHGPYCGVAPGYAGHHYYRNDFGHGPQHKHGRKHSQRHGYRHGRKHARRNH